MYIGGDAEVLQHDRQPRVRQRQGHQASFVANARWLLDVNVTLMYTSVAEVVGTSCARTHAPHANMIGDAWHGAFITLFFTHPYFFFVVPPVPQG